MVGATRGVEMCVRLAGVIERREGVQCDARNRKHRYTRDGRCEEGCVVGRCGSAVGLTVGCALENAQHAGHVVLAAARLDSGVDASVNAGVGAGVNAGVGAGRV